MDSRPPLPESFLTKYYNCSRHLTETPLGRSVSELGSTHRGETAMTGGNRYDSQFLDELKEFASFTTAEQRYIRRSLEVASAPCDAAHHWARGIDEAATMDRQAQLYASVDPIRSLIPIGLSARDAAALLTPLIEMSAFDLQPGKLGSFAAYRFLYERLLGPSVRPWLPSAFGAAAMLPCIHPELRGELLASLRDRDATSFGWSSREPVFFPEWVEKVPLAACC